MLLVSRIDPLRAVSAEEIAIECQSAEFFQHRDTLLLGAAGKNRAFINHHRTGAHYFSDGFACAVEREQIRLLVFVHRSRHRNDEDVAVPEVVRIRSIFQAMRRCKVFSCGFQSGVHPAPEHIEALLFDIESDDIELFPEFDSQRQSHVAQSDQGKFYFSILNFLQHHLIRPIPSVFSTDTHLVYILFAFLQGLVFRIRPYFERNAMRRHPEHPVKRG